jgi:hypothetical protein
MRINRNNSECRDGNYAGRGTSTQAISGGYGATITGGTGGSDEQTTQAQNWFQPVGADLDTILIRDSSDTLEISDCPGGICPVPWAKKDPTPWIKKEEIEEDQEKIEELIDQELRSIFEDEINHPSHYTEGRRFEAIDVIEDTISRAPDPVLGNCQGQILRYILRMWDKDAPLKNAKKTRWYLDRLIQHLEADS